MINDFFGLKISQQDKFNRQEKRIPVTLIEAGPCFIVNIKEEKKDGYNAIILGFGKKSIKNIKKPILGIIQKARIKNTPRFLKEIRLKDGIFLKEEKLKIGQEIKIGDVFKIGDKIDVSGISKGKGFAGVVKRHHFAGGPKTHGQSDRHRAPGSIGQSTTPGRVYKGKRMAGHMGQENVTIKNLEVIDIDPQKNLLIIKGLVPGGKNSLLEIKKVSI